ncbi:MAG: hypothetical protein ABTD50_07295 [Polyangiaceae bacterium]|jgi:hypothetical protein
MNPRSDFRRLTVNRAETSDSRAALAGEIASRDHPSRDASMLMAAQLFVLVWSLLRLRLVATKGVDLDGGLAFVLSLSMPPWLAATWARSRPDGHETGSRPGPKRIRSSPSRWLRVGGLPTARVWSGNCALPERS